jgi:HK97 family phage prohead protease
MTNNLKQLFAEVDRSNRETDELIWKVEQNRKKRDNLVHKELISHTKGLDFILSDATPDRYDDIILTAGWKLENFKKNPIALFSHRSDFPIGVWESVRVEDNALRGTLVLAPKGSSARIDELHALIEADVLKAVSVGFTPISYEERKGDTYGLVYTEQELVECSLVSVPANPSALIQARSLGISDETQELVFAKRAEQRPEKPAAMRQAPDGPFTSLTINILEVIDQSRLEMRRELADFKKELETKELRKEVARLRVVIEHQKKAAARQREAVESSPRKPWTILLPPGTPGKTQ